MRRAIWIVVVVMLVGGYGLFIVSRPRPLLKADRPITGMAVSPAGGLLAVADGNGVRVVHIPTGAVSARVTGERIDPWSRLRWDSHGRYLLWVSNSMSSDVYTTVYDVTARTIVKRLDGELPKRAEPLAGDPTVLLKTGHTLRLVDETSWALGPEVGVTPCTVLYFSSAQDKVVCSKYREEISVRSISSAALQLQQPDRAVDPVASPDGQWVLTDSGTKTGAGRGQVELLDLRDGRRIKLTDGLLQTAVWLDDKRVAVVVSEDGQRLILVDITSLSVTETGIRGSFSPGGFPVHWDAGRHKLWAIARETRVSAWATFSRYYLFSFDPRVGQVSRRKMPPGVASVVWDDGTGSVFAATDSGDLWAIGLN